MLESTLKTEVGMLGFRSCSGPDGPAISMPSMRDLRCLGIRSLSRSGVIKSFVRVQRERRVGERKGESEQARMCEHGP